MNIYELIEKAEDLVDEAHNAADNEMFLDSRSLLLKLMSYLIDNIPKIEIETPPGAKTKITERNLPHES